jgi:hypothetical protein
MRGLPSSWDASERANQSTRNLNDVSTRVRFDLIELIYGGASPIYMYLPPSAVVGLLYELYVVRSPPLRPKTTTPNHLGL